VYFSTWLGRGLLKDLKFCYPQGFRMVSDYFANFSFLNYN
jgi:hypothetical protein